MRKAPLVEYTFRLADYLREKAEIELPHMTEAHQRAVTGRAVDVEGWLGDDPQIWRDIELLVLRIRNAQGSAIAQECQDD